MASVNKKTVIIIGGPTASGKSGLALSLAQKLNGVVINGDSVQLFQGLPMLTACPSDTDKNTAPHKLYEVLPPTRTDINVATWRDMVMDEINTAHTAGQMPIVVGGTGFYLKTLVDGISPMPDIPDDVRQTVTQEYKDMGNDAFHTALQKIDPVMAEKLHPSNTQRLIRAMEVIRHTGQSLSHFQNLPPIPPPDDLNFKIIHLLPEREKLYARCDKRFLMMMDMGAMDEATAFYKQYPNHDTALEHALGYHEIIAYTKGDITKETAIEKSQQRTRNYAKRQVTWFKHQQSADLVLDQADVEKVISILD